MSRTTSQIGASSDASGSGAERRVWWPCRMVEAGRAPPISSHEEALEAIAAQERLRGRAAPPAQEARGSPTLAPYRDIGPINWGRHARLNQAYSAATHHRL